MDGFKAFKYYMALKLHFTSEKFDVFRNKGRIKGSLEKFSSRNDRNLYEKVAKKYPTDKQCIMFFASNFMYGHNDIVYDMELSDTNYIEYQRRRQAITRMVQEDVDMLVDNDVKYSNTEFGKEIPEVFRYFLAKKIKLETMVVIDFFDHIVDSIREKTGLSLLLGDELLRIEKSRKFVKFDSQKMRNVYFDFQKGIKHDYGQDVSSSANVF